MKFIISPSDALSLKLDIEALKDFCRIKPLSSLIALFSS